jgi:hypothetical protein
MLPVNPTYLRDYGLWAQVFLIAGAFVSADHYQRVGFGLRAFLAICGVNLVSGAPFIVATYGVTFGSPVVFTVVGVFAFLGLYLTFGLLGGGLIALIASAVRKVQ